MGVQPCVHRFLSLKQHQRSDVFATSHKEGKLCQSTHSFHTCSDVPRSDSVNHLQFIPCTNYKQLPLVICTYLLHSIWYEDLITSEYLQTACQLVLKNMVQKMTASVILLNHIYPPPCKKQIRRHNFLSN